MKQTDIIFHQLNIDKKIVDKAIIQQKNHFQQVNNSYPNFKY